MACLLRCWWLLCWPICWNGQPCVCNLLAAPADGLALLVISSELEELVGYADRVIIMRDRKQVAEIPLAELSVPAIMNAIAA